ncbi:MAG: hypothetical protein E7111_03435 [Bacteroidales bacterium]|nr:hypothetical protein [Bacteroidales bacterium]
MSKSISRTLIVGLGGTGQSVIRDVKKRLFRRYGEIPSLVKFLSFDTDDYDYQETPFEYYYAGENRATKMYNLTNAEFKKITRPSIEVLKSDENCRNLNFEQLGKIYGMANAIGANGYRVMGRAHVLYNAGSIMTMLTNTIHSLRNANLAADECARGYQLSSNGITVYVIASLAGGTGSSSFLDFSRMLQHAGIDVLPRGAASPSDTILGMFFMPSFFATKPNTPNVKINSYVALSELDYLLGLNDEKRYPAGCLEKENDLVTYDQYKDNKSVRYSNVYLVDDKTKQGHSHDFAEATGYVASFIAASIAADSQALSSCYSNSTHRLHDVDGKKQLYSGLGYCEIRFDRQNLVKYLLNKHLREVLSEYKSGDLDADRIADDFISQNQLNEGVNGTEDGKEDTRAQLNELTDSIYKLDDKRFATIVMGKVQTGKDAAGQIETNKVKFVNKISAEANEAVKEFASHKAQLRKNLGDLLSRRQTEKGFGCLPDLAKRLKSAFEAMKEGLEDELKKHEVAELKIEDKLRKHKANINNNTSKGILFGIGSKEAAQSDAIRAYMKEVDNIGSDANPTLMRIKLEIARKKEAIDIYDSLIKVVDAFYKEEKIELGGDRYAVQITGSASDVQAMFDSLKSSVQSEFDDYKYSKAPKNEVIFVDGYFKEFFDTHKNEAFELTEQDKVALDDYIKEIFTTKPQINKELIAQMRKFILDKLPDNTLVKRIKSEALSLDQLFVHCFGEASKVDDYRDQKRYPHLGLFGQMEALFDSLWQYDDFRGDHCQAVAQQCVVGVFDINNHLLDGRNGYHAYLPSGQNYQYINVGDPDRIIFVLQETAIPAFKMSDASVWKGEYKDKKGVTYSFSDKRLEDIDLLFPETANELGDIAWAYGWLFGLLASVNGRIQVKASQAYLSKTQQVLGNSGYLDYFAVRTKKSSDLSVCRRQFVKDEELFTDIYNQVMDLIDSDRQKAIIKIFHWVNDGLLWEGRGKLKTSMNEGERLVIQNEANALAKRFARLNSASVEVRLNKFGQIEYTDSLGILAEEEKKYQANLLND